MTLRKTVTLQGIHFAVHTPTEERLTFQIDNLTPATFRRLGMDFEDWSAIINNKYKDKTTRGGRSWHGRGHRVQVPTVDDNLTTTTERIRIIRTSPFPSAFSNTLRAIRRELYIELRRHCLVLEGDKHGGYKQNLYILPYANAASMMAAIVEQNKVIDDLNVKITQFQSTQEFQDFLMILGRNKVVYSIASKNWNIEHISFDADKLTLDPGAVMQMVKTARSNIATELKEYEAKGMEELNNELEKRRTKMVTQALTALKRDIDSQVAIVVAGMKRDPEHAIVALEQLRNKVVSIGLDALATSIIDPLNELIKNPDHIEELFGTTKITDLPSKVDAKIRSFIETM